MEYDSQHCFQCTNHVMDKSHPNGGTTNYCQAYRQYVYEVPFRSMMENHNNNCPHYKSDLVGY
jgi:hypothetical protein